MLTIGLLGCGVVGSGVMNLIDDPASDVCRNMRIKRILARSLSEKDDPRITTNYEDILNDSDIDTVIECMGGDEPAFTYVKAALESGRNVVSSNKKMLAHHLMELEDLAEKHHVSLLMEAAVGGGIPFLCTVHDLEMVEPVTAFEGIFNGTTNYILTRMAAEGASYEDVLKDAQALGFAEADPTGDVEGYDAANKLSVLMATAFGVYRAPDSFERIGITGVTMEDLAAAEAEGKVIKLLACAEEKDGGIEAYVKPVAVEKDSFLGRCGSEFNAVQIDCNMAGPIFLQGKGAGPEPTGSAVLGDIIEIAQAIAAGTEHEQPFTALI